MNSYKKINKNGLNTDFFQLVSHNSCACAIVNPVVN